MSKTALFKAARAWDAETIQRCLAADKSLLQARDSTGRTALHVVCGVPLAAGYPSGPSILAARTLLDAGMDVNVIHDIPDDGEMFPANALWHALGRGRNRDLAAFLLSAGAAPDMSLWTVVWSDDVAALRMLLAAGAKTENRFDGETPLLYAAKLGRVGSLLELLRAGADSRTTDNKGRSVLDHALRKKVGEEALAALRAASMPNR